MEVDLGVKQKPRAVHGSDPSALPGGAYSFNMEGPIIKQIFANYKYYYK